MTRLMMFLLLSCRTAARMTESCAVKADAPGFTVNGSRSIAKNEQGARRRRWSRTAETPWTVLLGESPSPVVEDNNFQWRVTKLTREVKCDALSEIFPNISMCFSCGIHGDYSLIVHAFPFRSKFLQCFDNFLEKCLFCCKVFSDYWAKECIVYYNDIRCECLIVFFTMYIVFF